MSNSVDNQAGETGEPLSSRLWRPGLSSRILALTTVFVLVAEALIFFPSLANYNRSWLTERVEMAQTAILAVEATPERRVSDELSIRLLENAQIVTVAASSDMGRELILSPAMEMEGRTAMIDLREMDMIPPVRSTIDLIFQDDVRFIRVLDHPIADGDFIEVVVAADMLRSDLIDYANRLLWLSLFISAFVGLLVYFSLHFLVVKPIRRITQSIEQFRDAPHDRRTHVIPTGRVDEIGRAETTLADMETTVRAALKQRERLAQLGEAMAKINHDLRNSLTSAQIVSDSLSQSEDPRVKRTAPRLERAIERAIALAEDTLTFGRSETPAPNIQPITLQTCADEAAFEALAGVSSISWLNTIDAERTAMADPDHVHRILVNLIRNAAQALSAEDRPAERNTISLTAASEGGVIRLLVSDTGTGIPQRVQETLFRPFSVSGNRKGSGLGLAIARELAEGMDGQLSLVKTDSTGTVFELVLPAAD